MRITSDVWLDHNCLVVQSFHLWNNYWLLLWNSEIFLKFLITWLLLRDLENMNVFPADKKSCVSLILFYELHHNHTYNQIMVLHSDNMFIFVLTAPLRSTEAIKSNKSRLLIKGCVWFVTVFIFFWRFMLNWNFFWLKCSV